MCAIMVTRRGIYDLYGQNRRGVVRKEGGGTRCHHPTLGSLRWTDGPQEDREDSAVRRANRRELAGMPQTGHVRVSMAPQGPPPSGPKDQKGPVES